MKTAMTWAVLLCITLGCGGVLSTHPVGGEPVAIASADWEGTWIGEDGPLEIRVVDGAAGRLEVAWIEESDGAFGLETITVELRRLEDWTIANLQGIDDEDEGYLWLRVECDQDRLLAWLPREEELRRLVSSGELPGTVEDGEVVLARLEAGHLARLRDESRGPLFVWDDPVVLRRLGA